MSGEKKFLAENFQQFYGKCSLLGRTNVLGWIWIFCEIIEKITFGSEPNVFKLCQQSFVSIVKLPPTYPEEPFLEDIFREKIYVWVFFGKWAKKGWFPAGKISAELSSLGSISSEYYFDERNWFWKNMYTLSKKILSDFERKFCEFLSTNCSSKVVAIAVNVSGARFWEKIYFLEKIGSFTKVFDSELEIFEHFSKNFQKGCKKLLLRVHRKILRKKVNSWMFVFVFDFQARIF